MQASTLYACAGAVCVCHDLGGTGGTEFTQGYHLYVALACPWADGALAALFMPPDCDRRGASKTWPIESAETKTDGGSDLKTSLHQGPHKQPKTGVSLAQKHGFGRSMYAIYAYIDPQNHPN